MEEGDTADGGPWWPAALVAVAALAVGVAVSPDRPSDDAAILLRYAERLGTGHGLTYNDHERVLGSSSGLWTLLLGALRAVGLPVVGTARVLAVALLAASSGLAARLAQRLAGPGAALLAGLLLLAHSGYTGNLLAGMETALAVTLALAALTALARGHELAAGALVGLALWNKLDAATLLLAVAGAWWWDRRRPPWRLVAVAAAVVAPYLLFCTASFGSPIPQSALAKVTGGADAPGWTWDPTWAVRGLLVLVPALPAVALALARRRGGADRAVAVALAGWGALHLAAVSLVPTGGRYPWYLVAPYLPVAVLAGAGAVDAGRLLRRGRTRPLAAAALAGALLAAGYPVARAGVDEPPTADQVAFDRQLPEVLAWLEPRVRPGDVVRSCYGGVALALPEATIDDRCGLTSDEPPRPPVWDVTSLAPDAGGAWHPDRGWCVARASSPDPARPGDRRMVVTRPC